MKILVVEDNPVNAAMVRVTLEKERYEVVSADDGEQALAELDAHPDIDLVVTDVMMPSLTGLEMLERIRRRPEWKTLPVVVATSLANQQTVRQAVSLHCKHFIVKPFTVQLLLQTVREAIGARGAVLQEKTLALSRIGIDGAGYDQLALAFAAMVHERVAALEALAEREQQQAIDVGTRRDLYALDESAALIGAERLGKVLAAFGLPSGEVGVEALGGVYKAVVTELRLLQGVLPTPPKKPIRLDGGPAAAAPASPAPADAK